MTEIPRIDVDLAQPPLQRWAGLRPFRREFGELLAWAQSDVAAIAPLLRQLPPDLLPTAWRDELSAVAVIMDRSADDVVLANLYYDVLKVLLGCSAFAVTTANGVLHGRNLDWFGPGSLLAEATVVVRAHHSGVPTFHSVGWPGFTGVLSGVSARGFSITLNAVTSNDPVVLGIPVAWLIRDVLTHAPNFAVARTRLATTAIAADCLLLLAGGNGDELAVIERTPTRHAVRTAVDGVVLVTNDYRALPIAAGNGELAATSCGRFDCMQDLLRRQPPRDLDDCRRILADPQVRMGITVQHMAFDPVRGEVAVWRP
jgi:hypothetical protein